MPEEIYEGYGAVPNIVFPSGALMHKNGRVDVYYGGADTTCAKASLNLPDLLSAMIPERRGELGERNTGKTINRARRGRSGIIAESRSGRLSEALAQVVSAPP